MNKLYKTIQHTRFFKKVQCCECNHINVHYWNIYSCKKCKSKNSFLGCKWDQLFYCEIEDILEKYLNNFKKWNT